MPIVKKVDQIKTFMNKTQSEYALKILVNIQASTFFQKMFSKTSYMCLCLNEVSFARKFMMFSLK